MSGVGPAAGDGPERGPGEARGLAVRDVVVHYRDDDGTEATAVAGVSLDVGPGEVVALLGPSGSGKSSLLRAVAGLEPVAEGTVTWDGVDLAGTAVHRRGFALMFQDGQLFPHRDVAGNVGYGVETSLGRDARRARVTELLALVGLAGFEGRDVASLSGGERQRVALARSLAPRPRLLLLDEPLSALDRALRERLAGQIRAVLTATRTPAIFVTHDHDEAFAVADRIAVLDEGRLLQVARPVELWRHPASRRVAEFLGYEAFVPAARWPWLVGAPGTAVIADTGPSLAGVPGDAGSGAVGAGSGGGEPGPSDDAVLAVGPGALVVAEDGSATGRVVASGFRRGVTETVVDVVGLGEVTVVDHEPVLREPGTEVRLGGARGTAAGR